MLHKDSTMYRTKQAFFRDATDMMFLENTSNKNLPKVKENINNIKNLTPLAVGK